MMDHLVNFCDNMPGLCLSCNKSITRSALKEHGCIQNDEREIEEDKEQPDDPFSSHQNEGRQDEELFLEPEELRKRVLYYKDLLF